jgi:poly(A) polymerase
VLLAALLLGPVEEALDGARNPGLAFTDFLEDAAARLMLPRRRKDRMASVVVALGRMRAGRLGALPRRDFFADAAALFALDQEARGKAVPSWAEETEPARAVVELPDRRRRRRRRRR